MSKATENAVHYILGVTHYNAALITNILKAKVAMENGDLQTAMNCILENQLREATANSAPLDMDDVTRLLNTPVTTNGPTLREVLAHT